MKYYYALKVLILNGLSKILPPSKCPTWLLNWFMKRYIYNLRKLCTIMNDLESLEKINNFKI